MSPSYGGSVLTRNLTSAGQRLIDLSTCTRSSIREAFQHVYDLNESLFTSLNDEAAFYKCPDRLRLPLIFYYAHTAVVYVNKMKLAGLLKERINLAFEIMFETGVDEFSWDDMENYRMGGTYEWPPVAEVVAYRRRVREAMLRIIDSTPLDAPIDGASPWWAVLMGIEHECIHIETSSVLIRHLPVTMVHRPEPFHYAPVKHVPVETRPVMLAVQGGSVVLGKPREYPTYGWDNEYGRAEMQVEDFESSKFLITNGQFLEFVQAGGYQTREYWSTDGWKWRSFKQARHPIFWVCGQGCKSNCGADLSAYSHCRLEKTVNGSDHESVNGSDEETVEEKFQYRAMFDVLDLPLDWPVDVNYHEAKAYCAWLGRDYRLPTEAEFQCIRDTRDQHSDGVMEPEDANINLQYFSSSPVNLYPPNRAGFHDTSGNVWQWLEDDFNGLPGFESNKFYDDFSSPQFDGDHTVILGGSWASTSNIASKFARYVFRRHFSQHAGFRVCRNVQPGTVRLPVRIIKTSQVREMTFNTEKYLFSPVASTRPGWVEESSENVVQTLTRDYLQSETTLAETCHQTMLDTRESLDRVLVIGCETGKLAFQLSQYFQKVVAVDSCAAFISVCKTMQKEGVVRCQNGQLSEFRLPNQSRPDNIVFKQFTWLPNELGSYKVVVFNNADRVLNTEAYTLRLPELVQEGGLLFVPSSTCKGETCTDLLRRNFSLKDVSSSYGGMVSVLARH